MSFFISEAMAEGAAQAAPAAGAGLTSILYFLVLGAVFYFFLIRPQSKRVKEHKKLMESLAKDDEVVTGGGVMGRITLVGDDFVSLEIADGIIIKVQKQFVTATLPKGTLKAV